MFPLGIVPYLTGGTLVGLGVGFIFASTGLFILLNRRLRASFSWRKIVALGLFGSFNKGIAVVLA